MAACSAVIFFSPKLADKLRGVSSAIAWLIRLISLIVMHDTRGAVFVPSRLSMLPTSFPGSSCSIFHG